MRYTDSWGNEMKDMGGIACNDGINLVKKENYNYVPLPDVDAPGGMIASLPPGDMKAQVITASGGEFSLRSLNELGIKKGGAIVLNLIPSHNDRFFGNLAQTFFLGYSVCLDKCYGSNGAHYYSKSKCPCCRGELEYKSSFDWIVLNLFCNRGSGLIKDVYEFEKKFTRDINSNYLEEYLTIWQWYEGIGQVDKNGFYMGNLLPCTKRENYPFTNELGFMTRVSGFPREIYDAEYREVLEPRVFSEIKAKEMAACYSTEFPGMGMSEAEEIVMSGHVPEPSCGWDAFYTKFSFLDRGCL